MRNPNYDSDYGIQQLRRKGVFDNYGMGGQNYMDQDQIGMVNNPVDPYNPDPEFSRAGPPAPNSNMPQVNPPPNIPQVDVFGQQSPVDKQAAEAARLKALYEPEDEATKAFQAAINAQPQRHDPGMWGRIGASLTGVAHGSEAAQKQLYGRQDRELAEWKLGIEPKYQAANLERQSNLGRLQIARDVMHNEDIDRKQDELIRASKAKEDTANKNAETLRLRAEAQNMRDRAIAAKNEGGTVIKAGDRLISVFPDGRKLDIGPSGGMDRELEIELLGKWDIKKIEARGEEAQQTKRTVPGKAGGGTNDGGEGGFGGGKEFEKNRNRKMQILYDTHPLGRKYLKPPATVNGDWQLSGEPEPGWFNRHTKEREEYQNFVKEIYGQPTTPIGGSSNTSSTAAPPSQPIAPSPAVVSKSQPVPPKGTAPTARPEPTPSIFSGMFKGGNPTTPVPAKGSKPVDPATATPIYGPPAPAPQWNRNAPVQTSSWLSNLNPFSQQNLEDTARRAQNQGPRKSGPGSTGSQPVPPKGTNTTSKASPPLPQAPGMQSGEFLVEDEKGNKFVISGNIQSYLKDHPGHKQVR